MGSLYGCSVRLLSGHVGRGEKEAPVIVFIGLPLPGRCTWHLCPPGGAPNYFKLINRCWMGRLMGQDIWEGGRDVEEKQGLNFQHLDPSNSSSKMALIV